MKWIVILLGLLAALPLAAQQRAWSLDECMAYAVQNSTRIKKQQAVNDNYRQNRIQSVAAMLPGVSASGQGNWGFGRSIDPGTNTYGNTANFNNSYSVSASLPLFNGFSAVNTLRASRIAELRGVQEAQKLADDIALQTMQAYFDALYYKEAVELAREQLIESQSNAAKTARMAELGLKAAADVAQVEAQAAADEYNLIHQQNLLEAALLELKDCMNYPLEEALEIEKDTGRAFYIGNAGAGEVYGFASQNLPQALIAGYALRESELDHMAARGRQLPNIYASGGYSTNYFRNITGGGETESFKSQFKHNSGEWIGLTMSIPIFNGLQRRTAVNRSRNALDIARQQTAEARRQLQSEITKALLDVEGLSKEYAQAVKRSSAYGQAHEANLRRYGQGTLSALDLQTSANQLLQSRAQQLQVELNYLMRSRLVEFYRGRPLIDR